MRRGRYLGGNGRRGSIMEGGLPFEKDNIFGQGLGTIVYYEFSQSEPRE